MEERTAGAASSAVLSSETGSTRTRLPGWSSRSFPTLCAPRRASLEFWPRSARLPLCACAPHCIASHRAYTSHTQPSVQALAYTHSLSWYSFESSRVSASLAAPARETRSVPWTRLETSSRSASPSPSSRLYFFLTLLHSTVRKALLRRKTCVRRRVAHLISFLHSLTILFYAKTAPKSSLSRVSFPALLRLIQSITGAFVCKPCVIRTLDQFRTRIPNQYLPTEFAQWEEVAIETRRTEQNRKRLDCGLEGELRVLRVASPRSDAHRRASRRCARQSHHFFPSASGLPSSLTLCTPRE